MTERPILFSGPMVRAILDGRKTQTRRVMTPQPEFSPNSGITWRGVSFGMMTDGRPHTGQIVKRCPYGRRGASLWVREAWGLHTYGDETDWLRGSVRGIPAESLRAQYNLVFRADWGPLQEGCFWRPGIFMARWASRITLEIANVRVQRLIEISEGDARAEGVAPYTPPHGHISPDQRVSGMGFWGCHLGDQPHRLPFADAWDRINGKRAPWASNPWVWAITFGRKEAT